MLAAATKKMRDGNKNYGAQRGRSQRVKEAAAKNSKLGENPASDVRTDQTKHDIRDAAETASASNLSRQPSRDQAEEKPRDEPCLLYTSPSPRDS